MKEYDKEFCDLMEMFDKIAHKEFYGRLDKSKDKIKGIWYDDGKINDLFKSFLHGYEYHKKLSNM